MSEAPTERRPPAIAAIVADVQRSRSTRIRRFAIAVVLEVMALAAFVSMMGPRPDLWTRDGWRIAVEIGAWVVAVVAVPALALGLWHPARVVIGTLLAGTTVGLTLAAVAPAIADDGRVIDMCAVAVMMAAFAGFVAAVLAGSFATRRARASTFYAAAGVTLVAFAAVTWVCPRGELVHVVAGHWGPALLSFAMTFAAGIILRRRADPPSRSTRRGALAL